MKNERITQRLLLYESIGFGLIIMISWLDELIGLPRLVFGSTGSGMPNWHEASLETAVILGVALPTIWLTRRLAYRVIYLEGFLHVCAWCRKINVNDHWVPMEQYFKTELKTKTTHGVCQECAAKFMTRSKKSDLEILTGKDE